MIPARVGANLATVANSGVGVGAILYVLAGNKVWAMLLIVIGIGFDGLDGLLSRRAKSSPRGFGRLADSLADGITFGLAPASLVLVHTANTSAWAPWSGEAWIAGGVLAGLAVARLTYFTLRAYQLPFFLGAPTPQTALAVILIVLFWDVPGFFGVAPTVVILAVTAAAIGMILPVRFPKVRQNSPIRLVTGLTAGAIALTLIPLQFFPTVGSWPYRLAFVAALASAVGVALYYVWGPLTVPTAGDPTPEVSIDV
jgi:phosphatidylserine synthase